MPRHKTGDGHPTRVALMDTAQQLIDKEGVGGFSVEDVLVESGVSKGSLYYHFEDFSDLIEATHLRRFTELAETDISLMGLLLVGVTCLDEFRQRLLAFSAAVYDVTRANHRVERLVIAASASHGSPRLRQGFAEAQQRLQASLSSVVAEAQAAGYLRPDLSPDALSSFIFAVTFGRVISELGGVEVPSEDSTSTLSVLLGSLLPEA